MSPDHTRAPGAAAPPAAASPAGGAAPERLHLSEADARRVLLARAVEEADPEGVLLPLAAREEAAHVARGAGTEAGAFLAARARALTAALAREVPAAARLVRAGGGVPWGRAVLVLAFVLGLGSNVVGPTRRIHVLANPLAGLLAWNAFVIGLFVLEPIVHRLRPRREPEGEPHVPPTPAALLARLVAALPARAVARAARATENAPRASALSRASARFLAEWGRVSVPLAFARLKRTLHMAAIAAVVGALLGLYTRGLVLEYRATWESTFLTPESAQPVLNAVLQPAARLSGIAVPPVEAVAGPDGGPAAPWLHLYALTALLFVVVPRALLAWSATRHARAAARAVPVDLGALYYRRLVAGGRGVGLEVVALPYSYALAPRRADALRSLLHDVFGGRARVEVRAGLEYGAEADEVAVDPTRPLVLVFNLAQTPEVEVHGRLVEGLQPRARHGLVVLADAAAWRDRAGSSAAFEERLAEHRRTWERMARDVGVPIVHVDLDEPPDDGLLARIEAALVEHAPAEAAR